MKKTNKATKGIIGFIGTVAIVISTIVYINPNDQKIDLRSNNVQGVILHTSATREGQKNVTAKTVNDYHTVTKKERVNPYNAIVEYDGNTVWYRSWNADSILNKWEVSWGSGSYNICCYNICYIGGMDSAYKHPKNTLTEQQDSAFKSIVFMFLEQYPNAYIIGHNQICNKACPSFDTRQKCLDWGVPLKNIWKLNSKYKIPEKYGKVIFRE